MSGTASVHACGDSTGAPGAAFYIEVGEHGRVTTLRLIGSLNLYTAPSFAKRVEEALSHDAWSLVISLAGVEQVDEDGLGALLRALRRVQQGHGTMLLCDVPDPVRKAITARGLGIVLHVFLSEALAVSFLTSWRSTP
jgi:anti-anti-sigma factor